MDRHKFRVWDKEKQEYVKYPMYLRQDGTLYCDKGGAYTQLRKAGDRFVVEFYTGLKDKNGTDLDWCQGDILAIGGGVEVEIVWSEHYGQWYAQYLNTIMAGKLLNSVAVYATNPLVEVIGTIHDKEKCETCNGKGTIPWNDPERTDIENVICPDCKEQP